MKKSYLLFLLLLTLSFGKVFSQACVVLGCAANYGTQTASGTLANNTTGALGGCYGGATAYKQVFWEFFYSPSGGNFTQAFTDLGGNLGNPMDLDYIVYDLGTSIPSSASITCPINPTTNGWSILICNVENTRTLSTGPGFGPGDGGGPSDVLATTAGHFYAIALVSWQGTSYSSPDNDATFSFSVGTPQIGGVNLNATNCPASIVLPVKLSSFGAKVSGCVVNLNWVAESETNFKKYEIESSADGRSFQTIGNVASVNSTSSQIYSYQQRNPQQGNLYYRLKMTDVNGAFEYSKTIAMKLDCNRSSVFVYPNPVTDVLNINITNSADNAIRADLLDQNGQLLYRGKLISGTNTIDMTRFAKGIYMLKLTGTAETKNIKVIK